MGKFDIQDEAADTVRANLINHMGKVHKMVDDGTQLVSPRHLLQHAHTHTHCTHFCALQHLNRLGC